MKPIRFRHDLLDIAARNAPTTATARKIREDGATVFGGVISPEGFPGWIVQAPNDRLIGVWINQENRKMKITYPDKMPSGSLLIRGVYL